MSKNKIHIVLTMANCGSTPYFIRFAEIIHKHPEKYSRYKFSFIMVFKDYPKMIEENIEVKEQCLNIDLAPTILEIAGIKKPNYMQGESMVNLLKGEKEKNWREAILFEYYVDSYWPYAGPNQIAVRTENYKLVDAFLENDIDELYDLKKDPGEMKNLINVESYDKIEEKLRDQGTKLKKQYKYNPNRDWWLKNVMKSKREKNNSR